MSNRHPSRDTVRIHNHIRYQSLDREGKIFLPVSHATNSLLSMPRGKFIADLRNFYWPCFYLGKLKSMSVFSYQNLLDVSLLSSSDSHRYVFCQGLVFVDLSLPIFQLYISNCYLSFVIESSQERQAILVQVLHLSPLPIFKKVTGFGNNSLLSSK